MRSRVFDRERRSAEPRRPHSDSRVFLLLLLLGEFLKVRLKVNLGEDLHFFRRCWGEGGGEVRYTASLLRERAAELTIVKRWIKFQFRDI